ncbi:MAG TPA: T9SS type A sorting domain-containing protein [Flavobacteriales bacterium]|nr:T9SS type A sorting domain-containing protein [Flavobacteriales bacterium]
MERNTTIASVLLLVSSSVNAQAPPSIVWQHNYGGPQVEHANGVVATADGGFVFAGMSYSNVGDITGANGACDMWVVKTDDGGDILWQHAIGGSGADVGEAIVQTPSGDLIVVGSSASIDSGIVDNNGGSDFFVVKLNSSGDTLWRKCFGGSGEDLALDVTLTNDGGCVVVGTAEVASGDVTYSYGLGDYWVLKLDGNGSVVWDRTLGGSSTDVATAVDACSDGGFIVCGYTTSEDWDVTGLHGLVDFWVVKLSGNGGIEWKRALGGGESDYAYSVRQTSDGGYVVVGESESATGDVFGNLGSTDVWLVKLSTIGDVVWQRCLGGTDGDRGKDVQVLDNGDLLIIGSTDSHDGFVEGQHGGGDGWVARLNSYGVPIWQRACGGAASDELVSACLTNDAGYVVVGSAISNDGDLTGNHGIYDCWSIRFGPDLVGIEEQASINFSIAPNPTSDVIRIQFAEVPSRSQVRVFNAAGVLVHNESSGLQGDRLTIDVRSWPAGVYALRVDVGDVTRTLRFVKE